MRGREARAPTTHVWPVNLCGLCETRGGGQQAAVTARRAGAQMPRAVGLKELELLLPLEIS